MMSKSTTASFIHNFPLITTHENKKELEARFNAAQQLKNVVLQEALKRADRYLQDETVKEAKRLYSKAHRTKDKNEKQQLKEKAIPLFNAARKKYQLEKYSLNSIGGQHRSNAPHLYTHIDSQTTKSICQRVMKSINGYLLRKNGRPHFAYKESIQSIESSTNGQGIIVNLEKGIVNWNACHKHLGHKRSNLTLHIKFESRNNRSADIEAHALAHRVKYCRILKKQQGRFTNYTLQVVFEGTPYERPELKEKQQQRLDCYGVDMNMHHIDLASNNDAISLPYSRSAVAHVEMEKEVKRLQRKMSRTLFLNNLDCYTTREKTKGRQTITTHQRKKGIKFPNISHNYLKLKCRKANLQRKLAAGRTDSHGYTVNQLLKVCGDLKIEKVWYRAWQRSRYGRAIGLNAPATLEAKLVRRAEQFDNNVMFVDPFKTALSQYCHRCGNKTQKKLSNRVHTCCDLNLDRDLYTALLVANTDFIDDEWLVDNDMVEKAIIEHPEKYKRK